MARGIVHDLRQALRRMRKAPAFAAVVIGTLALGIGANTAVFSVVDAVLLRPLPFAHPQQLVYVWTTDQRYAGSQITADYPDFRDWRTGASDFRGMAAIGFSDFTLTGQGEPLHLDGVTVSASTFSMLDVPPIIGRGLLPGEDRPGAVGGADAVVLSHRLWEAKFGGNRQVIGRRIVLDGRNYQIVGVMPAGFQFPITQKEDLWTTMAPQAVATPGPPMTEQRDAHMFWVVGRLKAGVTMAQAQAQMNGIARGLAERYPNADKDWSVRLVAAQEQITGDTQPMLLILLAAAGCVLLIACVNVANLFLARATGRRRELAVRAALGAGRGVLARQMLVESAMLGILGGGVGLLLAAWGTDLLLRLGPADVPRLQQAQVNGTVLLFALAAGLVTGILFGLFPALDLSRPDLVRGLREGGRSDSGSRHQHRWRGGLIVAEFGLALVVLISAALLIESFALLARVAPGFNPRHLLTASVSLPDAHYSEARRAAFFRELIARLRPQPGVVAAAAARPLPLSNNHMSVSFNWPEHPLAQAEQPETLFTVATPGYFRAMEIPQITGRDFSDTDQENTPQVVIVNQAFARKFLPGRNPLGVLIQPDISAFGSDTQPAREIIGVVADSKFGSLRELVAPMIYLPEAQVPFDTLSVVVRTAGEAASAAGNLRAAVRALNPDVPVFGLRPMESWLDASVAQLRFAMLLVSLFAALALALAAIGLYAVMAQVTAQRTREVGIRMALGAPRGAVLELVLRQGMAMAAVGAIVGLFVAWAATRLLAGTIYGVSAHDPRAYGGIVLLLLVVAGLACLIPAWRAARVDPIVALRDE